MEVEVTDDADLEVNNNSSNNNNNDEKEFRLVRLRNDSGDLGIFIARSTSQQQQQQQQQHVGYFVAFIMPDGVVKRSVSLVAHCILLNTIQ